MSANNVNNIGTRTTQIIQFSVFTVALKFLNLRSIH